MGDGQGAYAVGRFLVGNAQLTTSLPQRSGTPTTCSMVEEGRAAFDRSRVRCTQRSARSRDPGIADFEGNERLGA